MRGGWLLWVVVLAGCPSGDPTPPLPRRPPEPAPATTIASGVAPARAAPRSAPPPRPLDFREAKRALRELYDRKPRQTLYARCGFEKWRLDWSACCFDPGRVARRRLEWEHVVPAAAFGRSFREWTEGHRDCVRKGKPYHGRRCASRTSEAFRHMEGDMHNLYPAIGEINERRADLTIGLVDGEPRQFGRCDVEVDGVVEPPPEARGNVARAYLYMAATYPALSLDDATRALAEAWHAADPPDAEERERNDYIEQVQGNRNPWIDGP